MELDSLPVIDWELGTKLAGNKRKAAEEMLDLLINLLPNDLALIKKWHKEQNQTELLRQVHKLHGAICYCGLPRLKTILGRLETDLKNNIMVNLPSLLVQLDAEVNLLLGHYPRQKL